MKRPGFSLIELSVALAMAGIVLAAAVSVSVQVNAGLRQGSFTAEVDEQAKVLLDAMLVDVQSLGGGEVRPHSAIDIEDGGAATCVARTIPGVSLPACSSPGDADRLTIGVLSGATECAITSVVGNTLTSPLAAGACCLAGLANKNVLLVDATQTGYRASRCTTVNTNTCTCALATDAPGFSVRAPASVNGGVVAAGNSVTYFKDGANILSRVDDVDNNGSADIVPVSDLIFDLQAEYGFDGDEDGDIDAYAAAKPAAIASFDRLRQARVGVVIGNRAPARTAPSTASVLSGTPKTQTSSVVLRGVFGTVTLRNLLFFY